MAAAKQPGVSIHKASSSLLCSALLLINLVGNCGLVLYSHLGLSFVTFTNVPPPSGSSAPAPGPSSPGSPALCGRRRLSAACDAADVAKFHDRPFVNREMGSCGNACGIELLGSAACAKGCLRDRGSFSPACGDCWGDLLYCSALRCLVPCLADQYGAVCSTCQGQNGCLQDFDTCTGSDYQLHVLMQGGPNAGASNSSNTSSNSSSSNATSNTANTPTSNSGGGGTSPKWYPLEAGEISFTNSIEKLWNMENYVFAAILLFASGVNPYLECILLGVAWFVPMTTSHRARLLWWTNRVGRWSFLDIMVVVLLCCGLSMNLFGGTLKIAIETRWSIYAFGLATIWARFIGVTVEARHRRSVAPEDAGGKLACRCLAAKSTKRLQAALLVSSMVLLIAGIVGTIAPLQQYYLREPTTNTVDDRSYSVFAVGDVTSKDNLAGLEALLLLVVPYGTWGLALPIAVAFGLLVSQVLERTGQRGAGHALLGLCEMVGSAASLDVLLLASILTAANFGELILAVAACLPGSSSFDLEVWSRMNWGFYVLLGGVPAQWVMQEAALALHDRQECGTGCSAEEPAGKDVERAVEQDAEQEAGKKADTEADKDPEDNWVVQEEENPTNDFKEQGVVPNYEQPAVSVDCKVTDGKVLTAL